MAISKYKKGDLLQTQNSIWLPNYQNQLGYVLKKSKHNISVLFLFNGSISNYEHSNANITFFKVKNTTKAMKKFINLFYE